jgi:hypothetical protein
MMRLLSEIRNLAAPHGDGLFTKEQFVSGVLRECIISVSLCKTNACLEHGISSFLVRASGVCLRHCGSPPAAEVSDWDKCFALCLFVGICVGGVLCVLVLSALASVCFVYLTVIARLLVIPFTILWLWLRCRSFGSAPCAFCCNHTRTHVIRTCRHDNDDFHNRRENRVSSI